MPTPEPTTPARYPMPTQDLFLCCNRCSRPFIHSQSVRGVVAQERDPSIAYYAADHISSVICRPDDEVIISEGFRDANQVTDLSLTPIFCFTCREPVGWKVLGQIEMHPIVHVGQYLLPVPRRLH